MKLVYKGKTKDIYELKNGNYMMKFKDDMTGEDGVFDPGANTVGLTVEGVGREGIRVTKFFFDILRDRGIKTHYVDSNLEDATMEVYPATAFGKGIEVICRYKAVGSFMRRYGLYAVEGQDLDSYVEITLKDDDRNDPLITKDALRMLDITTDAEYDEIVGMTKEICGIIKEVLAENGLTLYDIKLEFGRLANGEVVLIDEISGGNMRVYKDDQYVDPFELSKYIFK
ncbi:MAG: phosphoribosylaminoimidazolesuccinocarboxamide synthase [Tissierellia bacterium]|nr:phosphoribosylaminoimidazolesuccinocarboxamide synthase [Tissierellia bacterium]